MKREDGTPLIRPLSDIKFLTPPVLQGFDSQGRLLTAQSVQTWEYLQEEIPQIQWQTRLTELGAEGWELVQQIRVERFGPLDMGNGWQTSPVKLECWLCFFKRPKVS